jgi:hypothetical protein
MNAAQRFGQDHGMPSATVAELVRLADKACRENTHECNGDRHVNGHPTDKSRNAKAWGRDLEQTTRKLRALVEPFGLAVEFTGLRPCLRDRAGHYVEIPHAN